MSRFGELRRRARWVEPEVSRRLREARSFRRAHHLDVAGIALLRAYSSGRSFGLPLLPSGLRLDAQIVDVGANHGDFTQAVLDLAPRATITAVEPEPTSADLLRRRFDGDPRVRVAEFAAAERAGSLTFHVTAGDVLSSTLEPKQILGTLFPGSDRRVATISVEARPLDDLVPAGPIAVMKIDVQGAELQALSGAEGALSRTAAVLLEVNFVSHYEGDALFGTVDEAMRARGFVLSAMTQPRRHADRAVWADACYVPVRSLAV